jgi:hypothetical protein
LEGRIRRFRSGHDDLAKAERDCTET